MLSTPVDKKSARAQSGFTLIELIVVIVVLGVVSIVAVPRFLSNDGFAEFSSQQKLQSALRTLQIKSMHNTNENYCYRMVFDLSLPAIGPSTNSYVPANQSASCTSFIDTSAPENLQLSAVEFSELGLSLQAQDGTSNISFIQFDSLGRPSTSAGTCQASCRITLSGQSNTSVCVEAQGYVHAC